MEMMRNKMPNTVTFVFDNGDLYTFILNFLDGENFGMLQDRFSNPLSWGGIWIAAGRKTLHFVDFRKIRHFYFSIVNEQELTILRGKINTTSKIDEVTGVGFGVLVVGDEIKKETPAQRVKDIPNAHEDHTEG